MLILSVQKLKSHITLFSTDAVWWCAQSEYKTQISRVSIVEHNLTRDIMYCSETCTSMSMYDFIDKLQFHLWSQNQLDLHIQKDTSFIQSVMDHSCSNITYLDVHLHILLFRWFDSGYFTTQKKTLQWDMYNIYNSFDKFQVWWKKL